MNPNILLNLTQRLALARTESEVNAIIDQNPDILADENILYVEKVVIEQRNLVNYLISIAEVKGGLQDVDIKKDKLFTILSAFKEEMTEVFDRYPEVLSAPAIGLLASSADRLLEVTEDLRKQKWKASGEMRQSREKPLISTSSVKWAYLVRRHLSLQGLLNQPDHLMLAIDEAKIAGEAEVAILLQQLKDYVSWIRSFDKEVEGRSFDQLHNETKEQTHRFFELVTISQHLAHFLVENGKTEESLTIALINADIRTLAINVKPQSKSIGNQFREDAIKSCQNAIHLSELVNDKPCLAFYLQKMSLCLNNVDDWDAAEPFCRQALQIYQSLAEAEKNIYDYFLATSYQDLGIIFVGKRRYAEAEEALQNASQIRRELHFRKEGNIFDVSETLNNLGGVYVKMGNNKEALKAFEETVSIREKLVTNVGDVVVKPFLASALTNLGIIRNKIGDLIGAEKNYRDSLLIYEELLDELGHAIDFNISITNVNLGSVLLEMARFSEAERVLNESLRTLRKLNLVDNRFFGTYVVTALNALGVALKELGKTHEAKLNLLEAAKTCQEFDIPDHAANVYADLGTLSFEQGDVGEAKTFFEMAVENIEHLRQESYSAERAKQILSDHFSPFEGLTVCLMKLGDIEKALEVSERGKSRSISDLMLQQKLRSQNTSPENVYSQASPLTTDQIKQLARDSQKTFVSFRFTEEETYIYYVFPDGTLEAQTKKDFTSSTLDDLLIKYETDENGNKTPVSGWLHHYESYRQSLNLAKEANEKFERNRTEKSEEILRESYNAFKIAEGSWHNEMDSVLSVLFHKLLISVHKNLKEKQESLKIKGSSLVLRELVIIPNRGLSVLPIHASWWTENGDPNDGKLYFLDDFVFDYAPSISIFKECWERNLNRNTDTLLAVVDPRGDLPYSREECESIRQHFRGENVRYLLENEARKEVVTNFSSIARVLHFACHGIYLSTDPFASFLELAKIDKDGLTEKASRLALEEIMGLSLDQASLVVLSACETGLGDIRRPDDEFYGLSLAFIIAGSPSVWGTLWSVRDDATKELMVRAYRNLKLGFSKTEALWAAQMEFRKGEVKNEKAQLLTHPFYWSGMQSFGV